MPESMEKAQTAQGFSVVFDACAEVFLNEPTDRIVSDLQHVANALGMEGFAEIECGEDASQHYYNRFFVPTSPLFVPLLESSIVGGGEDEDGTMRYASTQSGRADHALRCYRAVEFDYRTLQGFPPAVSNLHPDSLAAELAFLAHCKRREAEARSAHDDGQADHWNRLARRFAREHPNGWVGKAADCLARTDDDLYARACRLAAQAVDALLDEGESE